MSDVKLFYACAVDWRHEMGEAPDLEGNMPLYSSVEELKRRRECWTECGIVEIRMELNQWIEPDTFGSKK